MLTCSAFWPSCWRSDVIYPHSVQPPGTWLLTAWSYCGSKSKGLYWGSKSKGHMWKLIQYFNSYMYMYLQQTFISHVYWHVFWEILRSREIFHLTCLLALSLIHIFVSINLYLLWNRLNPFPFIMQHFYGKYLISTIVFKD